MGHMAAEAGLEAHELGGWSSCQKDSSKTHQLCFVSKMTNARM